MDARIIITNGIDKTRKSKGKGGSSRQTKKLPKNQKNLEKKAKSHSPKEKQEIHFKKSSQAKESSCQETSFQEKISRQKENSSQKKDPSQKKNPSQEESQHKKKSFFKICQETRKEIYQENSQKTGQENQKKSPRKKDQESHQEESFPQKEALKKSGKKQNYFLQEGLPNSKRTSWSQWNYGHHANLHWSKYFPIQQGFQD